MPPVTPLKANMPAIIGGGDIRAVVPANVAEMMQLAEILAKSEMVPKNYIAKPNDIVVAIMFGMELGIPPLASLRHVAVINGKPSLYGDGQLGVCMGKGHVEDFEEKITGTGETMKAVCRVKRRGIITETVREFEVADAKKAGLWSKQGPWSQYPKRMLQMRARSFALRDTFPDYLLGMSAEEMRDLHVGPDNARDVTGSVEQPPRAASRLDAFEDAMAGETEETAAPTDTSFGLPMEWPAPTADRKAWITAAVAANKEIDALPDADAATRWEELNGEGLQQMMQSYRDIYDRLYVGLEAKKEMQS